MGSSKQEHWKNILVFKKIKAVEHKGGKCERCGYDKCYGALEFHHRDPEQKEYSWSSLKKFSWDRIVAELDKCDILCANCHREVHETPGLIERVSEWRNRIYGRLFRVDMEPRTCPICGESFEPRSWNSKYCSRLCYSSRPRYKIDWPDNLSELVANSSKLAVAKSLGVSDKAVAKRLLRYH